MINGMPMPCTMRSWTPRRAASSAAQSSAACACGDPSTPTITAGGRSCVFILEPPPTPCPASGRGNRGGTSAVLAPPPCTPVHVSGSTLACEGFPDRGSQLQVGVLGGGSELFEIDLGSLLQVPVPGHPHHASAPSGEMLFEAAEIDAALAVGTHHRQHHDGPADQPDVAVGLEPVEGRAGAASTVHRCGADEHDLVGETEHADRKSVV